MKTNVPKIQMQLNRSLFPVFVVTMYVGVHFACHSFAQLKKTKSRGDIQSKF